MVHSLVKNLPSWLKSFYTTNDETHFQKGDTILLNGKYQSLQLKKYKKFCHEVRSIVNDCIDEGTEKPNNSLKLLGNLSSKLGLKTREDGDLDVPNAQTLIKIIEQEPALGKKIIYRLISSKNLSSYLRSPLKPYRLRIIESKSDTKAVAEAMYGNDVTGLERFLMDMPGFLMQNKTSSKELKYLSANIQQSMSSFHNSNPSEDSLIHNKINGSAKIGNCTFYSSHKVRIPSSDEAEQKSMQGVFSDMAKNNKGKSCTFTATVFPHKNKKLGHDVAFYFSFNEAGLVDKVIFANSNTSDYYSGFVSYVVPMIKTLSQMSLLDNELKREFSKLETQLATSRGAITSIESDTLARFKTKYTPEISKEMKVQEMQFDENCIRYAFYNASTMAILANSETGKLALNSHGEMTEEDKQKLRAIRPTGSITKNFLLQGIFDFNRKRDSTFSGYNKFIKEHLVELKALNENKKHGLIRKLGKTIASLCNKFLGKSSQKDTSFIGRQTIDVAFSHKDGSSEVSIKILKADPTIEPIISKIMDNVQKGLQQIKVKSSDTKEIELATLEIFTKELQKYKKLFPNNETLTTNKDNGKQITIQKSLNIKHRATEITNKQTIPATSNKTPETSNTKIYKTNTKDLAVKDDIANTIRGKSDEHGFRDKIRKQRSQSFVRSI